MSIEEQVQDNKFLYKRVGKVDTFRQIQVSSVRETYGVDLIDYTGNNTGNNRGYILIVIDYHSRYVDYAILKTKGGTEMDTALKKIFENIGPCEHIHADRESSLLNSKFLNKLGIDVYHTDTTNAHTTGGSPIAERVIQTLKRSIEQYRNLTVARAYKQHVAHIVDEYNHSVHRTIGMTPHDAFFNNNKELDQVQRKRAEDHRDIVTKKPDSHLKVGAPVVAPKTLGKFAKGYVQKWNKEILTIVDVINSNPITFKLSNGITAYASQLQFLDNNKVNLLDKKKQNSKPVENTTSNEDNTDHENDNSIKSRLRKLKSSHPSMHID